MLVVTVSRDLLGLQPLALNDPSQGLYVVRVGPGARQMRLTHATSQVSDGSVLTGATADLQTGLIVVRAYGTDPAAVMNRLAEVEAAFNQWTYSVDIFVDNHYERWTGCQPADHARGVSGRYEANHLQGGWQDLAAEIPHQPSSYGYA